MKYSEMKRLDAVSDLLALTKPVQEVAAQLAAIEWDYDGRGVVLTRRQLSAVLQRYLDAALLAKDVEVWANLVEAREDVHFEADCEQQIELVLYELANPTLTQPLDQDRASTILDALN